MGRRLVLEGPYRGRSIILQRCRFTNGVCDISHLSDADALAIGRHMATFYQAKLVDDAMSLTETATPAPAAAEETDSAPAEERSPVPSGLSDAGGAGVAEEAPALPARDAGAEARGPAVSGKSKYGHRNADRD